MKYQHCLTRLAFAVAVSTAIALPARADFIALDSTRDNGNQNYTGPMGMDFTVFAPIWISKLGAYDSSPSGFTSSISVGIFRSDGVLMGSSAVLTNGNTTIEGTGIQNRFIDIVDFILAPGNYSIVADGYSSSEANGNTSGVPVGGPTINTGGGLIGFTGTARYGASNLGLVYPTIIDSGPANRYDAGTFQFRAVPEPGSVLLAAIGLAGLAAARRRKRG